MSRRTGEAIVTSDFHETNAQGGIVRAELAGTWYAERLAAFEGALANHLKAVKARATPHSRLGEAVEYSMTAGGKRLRPVLRPMSPVWSRPTARLAAGSMKRSWFG